MQLILLALAVAVFIHDGLYPPGGEADALLPGPWLVVAVLVPKVLLAALYAVTCRAVYRRLDTGAARSLLRRLDRFTGFYQYAVLGLFATDLYLGALRAVRGLVTDTVLLDELAILLPTLALLLAAWWAYYPIDYRLRYSALMAQADAGLPVYPIWTRTQYVLAQVRHQLVLILAPLLLIMGWAEAVHLYAPSHWAPVGDPRPLLSMLGAVGTFLFAPVMLRHLWDTSPLAPGELRDRMLALCDRHRVRVREVLLWHTYGGVINAAVMGLFAPVRYILLSDALLDMLRKEEVEAVMAHELAHVRRRHMVWLLAAAIALIGLLEVAANLVLHWVFAGGDPVGPILVGGWDLSWLASPEATMGILMLGSAAAWIAGFGWVSRRIERQADAFAVAHLAAERSADPVPVVDHRDALAMIAALGEVARLNHISPRRRSWRHGAIAWRQAYLHALVGRRVDDLPIDRVMARVKLAILIGAALAAAGYLTVPLDGSALLLSP